MVLSQLMDADDANVTLNGFLCMSDVIKSTSKDGGVISTHCHNRVCCVLLDMNVVNLHGSHCLFEHLQQWLNGKGKEKRCKWTSLAHTSFSAEWL